MTKEDFKIHKDSWHYKYLKMMLQEYSYYEPKMPNDFCSYFRKLTFTLGAPATVIVLISCYMYLISNIFGIIPIIFSASLIVIALLVILLLFLIIHIGCIISENIKYTHEVKRQSLIATKIRSLKHKYCPLIKYEEKKND